MNCKGFPISAHSPAAFRPGYKLVSENPLIQKLTIPLRKGNGLINRTFAASLCPYDGVLC